MASDYPKVHISDGTKEKLKIALNMDFEPSDEPHNARDLEDYKRMREKETELDSWRMELDDRERRLARRELDFENATRLLEEKLGSDDVVKAINELTEEKERQRIMLEELHNEKQKVRQLGLKVSQEVKRAKAGFLREQQKLEQQTRDLEDKRNALEAQHKIMSQQIEELERISTGGNMTVIQNLSNRVLELTRIIAEHANDQGGLEQAAAQLKEQLNHSQQESNELQQRHSKLKQSRDHLHEQNRGLKSKINELDLERIRMRDSEDKLMHQIQNWEDEHANSNTELENLLHTLLELYRGENRMPSQSAGPTPQRRSANTYSSRLNVEHSRKTPTRSSLASNKMTETEQHNLNDYTNVNNDIYNNESMYN